MQKKVKMRRTFSKDFKREKVKLIELGKLKIRDIVDTYSVSETSVRNWLIEFGSNYEKTERIVLEKISEENKNIELMKKISELERIIGQQQMQIIYKDSIIETAEKIYGEDFKKKFK